MRACRILSVHALNLMWRYVQLDMHIHVHMYVSLQVFERIITAHVTSIFDQSGQAVTGRSCLYECGSSHDSRPQKTQVLRRLPVLAQLYSRARRDKVELVRRFGRVVERRIATRN